MYIPSNGALDFSEAQSTVAAQKIDPRNRSIYRHVPKSFAFPNSLHVSSVGNISDQLPHLKHLLSVVPAVHLIVLLLLQHVVVRDYVRAVVTLRFKRAVPHNVQMIIRLPVLLKG